MKFILDLKIFRRRRSACVEAALRTIAQPRQLGLICPLPAVIRQLGYAITCIQIFMVSAAPEL